ncbi:hypothetical protein NDU88_006481 [Pleurodeles waltl]|uniref:Uncharacterized protein n=1 Tax=Pleurodeles waltl TaxID=8319 RepID=A0AAV7TXS2_PLEWA|nr:hypothetical protein NDU88_006481 [Pleurodeles waltl]
MKHPVSSAISKPYIPKWALGSLLPYCNNGFPSPKWAHKLLHPPVRLLYCPSFFHVYAAAVSSCQVNLARFASRSRCGRKEKGKDAELLRSPAFRRVRRPSHSDPLAPRHAPPDYSGAYAASADSKPMGRPSPDRDGCLKPSGTSPVNPWRKGPECVLSRLRKADCRKKTSGDLKGE